MPLKKGLSKGESLKPISERLIKLGLKTDWDFVFHFPLRYEDETKITTICDLKDNQTVQVEVFVRESHVQHGRYEQLIADVTDGTGNLRIRYLHYYASQVKQLAPGNKVRLYGQTRLDRDGELEMLHPKISRATQKGVQDLPKTLTPIYPTGESIKQYWLRNRINRALMDVDIKDLLPEDVRLKLQLPKLRDAVLSLHHPKSDASIEAYAEKKTPAWRRIKFDEFLAQQIALQGSRKAVLNTSSQAFEQQTRGLRSALLEKLPFKLTAAQQKVIDEIGLDLSKTSPMNRLLQGDVGAGKTIVAAVSALQVLDHKAQVALMAPTEILAEQHYNKLKKILAGLPIRLEWISGSLKVSEKTKLQNAIAEGTIDFVIGTHALISDNVHFKHLGLVIIDEQHRFGVEQRVKLRNSTDGLMPHLLMLSATPIPRTLAMSYLADIDVSVIDQLPPGRSPIKTALISMDRLDEVVSAIHRVLNNKEQVYWVCPLIETSEKSPLTPALERAKVLKDKNPDWRISVLHGAMKAEEKQTVMQSFLDRQIDLLVSTTVIEVGVDVANATVMIIEQAERFGLAQLHQLRGRIGRGSAQGHCILLYSPEIGNSGSERLKIIRDTNDGFEIARADLKMRGPGEFLGAKQSGMPMLRFADTEKDLDLLEAARTFAAQWLDTDPKSANLHKKRWHASHETYLEA